MDRLKGGWIDHSKYGWMEQQMDEFNDAQFG